MVSSPPTYDHSVRMRLLYRGKPGRRFDAIAAHTANLSESLRRTGWPATETIRRRDDGRWTLSNGGPEPSRVERNLAPLLRDAGAVLVQYNPFSYGRWGFAPWLPAALARARVSTSGPWIGLMVHEAFVPMDSFKRSVMGTWQRVQLGSLLAVSDVTFGATEMLVDQLSQLKPRRPAAHLPVGSNLPDRREDRLRQRARYGADESTIVVASFGTHHDARMPGHLTRAVNRVAEVADAPIYLNLGLGAPALEGLDPSVHVVHPGGLDDVDLAAALSSVDIFLAAYRDGVSTRRGTFMAAAQHGLPTVATTGMNTDALLGSATDAFRLVPATDQVAFAEAAAALATNLDDRVALGRSVRALYEEHYDWPVVARRLMHHAGGS